MTQAVVVQVGQCGNQIGCRFWDLALREYAQFNKSALYDDAVGTFFRNVDSSDGTHLAAGGRIQLLKARAVLVDMEEGVVSEILQGPLRDVFHSTQLLTDVSGAGNNWAVGHMTYGSTYREKIVDKLRKAAEQCDCLQSFFLLNSMGGGTGSGLGTKVLSLLKDEFPEVCRIVTPVYPSLEDDVIISPYNSILAMRELTENADYVLPVGNQALIEMLNKISHTCHGQKSRSIPKGDVLVPRKGGLTGSERPFDAMNDIVAKMLLDLTSSARFGGSLNMDLNEIPMNLVPFPGLHYLVPSLSPLCSDVSGSARSLDQMFTDVFSKGHQLMKVDLKHSRHLACALMLRGHVHVSHLRRNIDRMKPLLPFVSWKQEGWKTSLCSVPPVGLNQSLLALSNTCAIKSTFVELRERFTKLYKRKAHLHHYLQVEGMEPSFFSEALTSLNSLIDEYQHLDSATSTPDPPRLTIAQ
ncbi:tubulin epsilon chain-like isoform X1 [Nerophis ophidion]|uniref:tubulin epsilon chain-like isoform X1 n=2 Tax=Nerophis ophidion TaxID=159077 RepID=UPI002ADF562D|nr:tubulin epsilon chain-like isoform X1 [Nerophis ophidion]XP_061741814.1 tubulin epsilon chain-like isoform X1 [Nerophis ophidion]XP_061741815.1 tubulin epsilon chain-like isoform X1 [Nerophis ophidion]